MKLIILVACALVAIAAAAPAEQEAPAPPAILRSEFNQEPEGGYGYGFETEDGVKKEETGEIKEVVNEEGKPQKVVVVRGSFSYTDPEGNVQNIAYVADEEGFRAEGPGIPKVESRR